MAIFNNGNGKADAPTGSNTTIITAGAKIKGEFKLECNLYIDGELEGSVHSSKEVNIGKNGLLQGSVLTERLVVQGHIKGNIDATRVEIKAGGHVSGEIKSKELVIEAKGVFEGNSIIKTDTMNKKQPSLNESSTPL